MRQARSFKIALGFLLLLELLLQMGCSTARLSKPQAVSTGRRGLFDRGERVAANENRSQSNRIKTAQTVAKSPASNPEKKGIPVLEREADAAEGGGTAARELPSHLSAGVSGRTVGSHSFNWPLKQVEVTSPFGKRGREFHEGIDLRAQAGTPVFAAQSGVVLYADTRIRGYGKMIVIRHPSKVNTIYAHNSKVLVKRGDRVKQGQQIAYSGNTGHSTGPHVHFEIRKGLAAVNPMKYLPRLVSKLSAAPFSRGKKLVAAK